MRDEILKSEANSDNTTEKDAVVSDIIEVIATENIAEADTIESDTVLKKVNGAEKAEVNKIAADVVATEENDEVQKINIKNPDVDEGKEPKDHELENNVKENKKDTVREQIETELKPTGPVVETVFATAVIEKTFKNHVTQADLNALLSIIRSKELYKCKKTMQ